ncbi:hypothetical protein OHB26_38090 [Nocardia sp. NBC_01503]|uniref:hypothetical protein n=1 Tax=Nocardia sp. NBC_01503 TaxID=2975997 RepID=UPI002E7B6F43|nr:hypothetical protein [Nocardia sp. NBC_01503]WTL32593.1 hypothetical protein OHB26_38090 [Nocardia sp. NBC_01503]
MTYILSVGETSCADLGPVIDRLGPLAKEVIMTTAQRLRAEGRTEGRTEGRAEALLEQLTLKYGELSAGIAATVRTADTELLRLWTARVLTAGGIDEVFQP